jgi:hypothetical protein
MLRFGKRLLFDEFKDINEIGCTTKEARFLKVLLQVQWDVGLTAVNTSRGNI